MAISRIVALLEKEYGPHPFLPTHRPVAELVLTILSQNTSDINSRPAFKALTERFVTWEAILEADRAQIAATIRAGGLGMIKAARIQSALSRILDRCGSIDLDFLEDMSVSEGRDWLRQLPGVGNKTANCVLLFALGKPALPVDTHIFRVSKRLHLIGREASLDDAHHQLAAMVPESLVFSFHVLMIEHGRKTCIARLPRCQPCTLNGICPSSTAARERR